MSGMTVCSKHNIYECDICKSVNLSSEIRRLREENERLQQELKGIGAEQFYDMRQKYWDSQKEVKRLSQAIDSYPTKDAYESACRALWKHRDRNDELEKQNAELAEVLKLAEKEMKELHLNMTSIGDSTYLNSVEFIGNNLIRKVLRKYGLEGSE